METQFVSLLSGCGARPRHYSPLSKSIIAIATTSALINKLESSKKLCFRALAQEGLVHPLHYLATTLASCVVGRLNAAEPALVEGVSLGAGVRAVFSHVYGVALGVGDKYDVHAYSLSVIM